MAVSSAASVDKDFVEEDDEHSLQDDESDGYEAEKRTNRQIMVTLEKM